MARYRSTKVSPASLRWWPPAIQREYAARLLTLAARRKMSTSQLLRWCVEFALDQAELERADRGRPAEGGLERRLMAREMARRMPGTGAISARRGLTGPAAPTGEHLRDQTEAFNMRITPPSIGGQLGEDGREYGFSNGPDEPRRGGPDHDHGCLVVMHVTPAGLAPGRPHHAEKLRIPPPGTHYRLWCDDCDSTVTLVSNPPRCVAGAYLVTHSAFCPWLAARLAGSRS